MDIEYKDFLDLKTGILKGVRPTPLTDEAPPLLKKLIERCWDADPTRRPSFKEMLADRMFDRILIEYLFKSVNSEGGNFWVSAFEYKVFIY